MPRFAANLSMLFNDVDFVARFARAARAEFEAVEFMSPYEHDAHFLRQQLDEHQLQMILFNMPGGDRPKGDRGLGCLPHRRVEFQESVEVSIHYAQIMGSKFINCLAGIAPEGSEHAELEATYVNNLRFVCSEAKKIGLKVVIEPLNPWDFPRFFLTRTDQAADIVAKVGADNLGIEYDVYHAQMAEGNLTATVRRFLPLIWHMQVADVPTRAQPGTGEIRFDYLLRAFDQMGYQGWIGCDYHPTTEDDSHLNWLMELNAM